MLLRYLHFPLCLHQSLLRLYLHRSTLQTYRERDPWPQIALALNLPCAFTRLEALGVLSLSIQLRVRGCSTISAKSLSVGSSNLSLNPAIIRSGIFFANCVVPVKLAFSHSSASLLYFSSSGKLLVCSFMYFSHVETQPGDLPCHMAKVHKATYEEFSRRTIKGKFIKEDV